MRLANLDGRATIVVTEDVGADVASASDGKFGPELSTLYANWATFRSWASTADLTAARVPLDRHRLGPPSPAPAQILAVGLNYRDHAEESGLAVPEGLPPVFTKFVTSLSGPDTTVVLPPGGHTDWEVELVVVLAERVESVDEHSAWSTVAGLCVGQDLSERIAQLSGPAPQFSFGKSFAGFAPTGPWLVTPDELADPDDLVLGCAVDGVEMQRGRTRDLVQGVGQLIALLSRGMTLLPGDLIFTGTPAGVGLGRSPRRFLAVGEHLESWIEGIGSIHQRFVEAPVHTAG